MPSVGYMIYIYDPYVIIHTFSIEPPFQAPRTPPGRSAEAAQGSADAAPRGGKGGEDTCAPGAHAPARASGSGG